MKLKIVDWEIFSPKKSQEKTMANTGAVYVINTVFAIDVLRAAPIKQTIMVPWKNATRPIAGIFFGRKSLVLLHLSAEALA